MHIKDYPTHPEKYKLKEILDEKPEKSIEDC
jgi:hypothetical protein